MFSASPFFSALKAAPIHNHDMTTAIRGERMIKTSGKNNFMGSPGDFFDEAGLPAAKLHRHEQFCFVAQPPTERARPGRGLKSKLDLVVSQERATALLFPFGSPPGTKPKVVHSLIRFHKDRPLEKRVYLSGNGDRRVFYFCVLKRISKGRTPPGVEVITTQL